MFHSSLKFGYFWWSVSMTQILSMISAFQLINWVFPYYAVYTNDGRLITGLRPTTDRGREVQHSRQVRGR